MTDGRLRGNAEQDRSRCSDPGGKVPSRASVPPGNSPPRPAGASTASTVIQAAGMVTGVPNFMNSARASWPGGPVTAQERSRPRLGTRVLTWAFACGAGDGNRTRTISLGSHCRCPLITCGDADLRPNGGVPVSARKLP
jgi:hypothetical protein